MREREREVERERDNARKRERAREREREPERASSRGYKSVRKLSELESCELALLKEESGHAADPLER